MEMCFFLCFFLLFSTVKNIRDSLSFLLPYSMAPFQLCKIGIHFEVLLKCSDKSMFHRRQSKEILNKYSIYSRTGGKFQHEKWHWYPTDVLCFTVQNEQFDELWSLRAADEPIQSGEAGGDEHLALHCAGSLPTRSKQEAGLTIADRNVKATEASRFRAGVLAEFQDMGCESSV